MNRIVVILWVLTLAIFASEEKELEFKEGLLAEEKNDITESERTEKNIEIYEKDKNEEIENKCGLCYFNELDKMNKVFRLEESQYTEEEQVFHLLHAKTFCEQCITDWLSATLSKGDCPCCKKLLSINVSHAATIWALRIYDENGKLTYEALSFIMSIPNILIPGFLSLPQGLHTILMKDMLQKLIFDQPIPGTTMQKFKCIFLWQVMTPLIANVNYLFHDPLNLMSVSGEESIHVSGENELIPVWQTVAMVGVPFFLNLLKFSPKRNIFPRATKLMDYANYFLPYCSPKKFFPHLYLSSILSTSSRRQETHWLLFLANIFVLSLYPTSLIPINIAEHVIFMVFTLFFLERRAHNITFL